jgi:hypothetical protein
MTIYEFSLPATFNGQQFIQESGANDVFVRGETLFVESEKSHSQLQSLLNNHKPKAITDSTVAQKLASVGLSIDDLKAALA